MNKDTEIKEVKDQIRAQALVSNELADRLEALETEPKRKPQAGDVWKLRSGNVIKTLDGWQWDAFDQRCTMGDGFYANEDEGEYLGTFNEVYMLRSDVEKDYISKAQLQAEEEEEYGAWLKMCRRSQH